MFRIKYCHARLTQALECINNERFNKVNYLNKHSIIDIISLLSLIFIISCVPVEKQSVPEIPENIKFSKKLEKFGLKEHAEYFINEYKSGQFSKKDKAEWGYNAIYWGSFLYSDYRTVSNNLQNDLSLNYIQHIPNISGVINSHLGEYSKNWRKAIRKTSSEYGEWFYCDFSTVLAIYVKEFKRLGLFEKIDTIKQNIKYKTSELDKAQYPMTYEVYGLISQLISLAENPTGSLVTFNQTVNKLNNELVKALVLAELEH
ncbi:MAG: hypothetical protein H8E71_01345 [Candidatus Marinimicrobia bacterium]|nr:hypothetical protein [Candidatus Neomarinimicrobiota bacterium]